VRPVGGDAARLGGEDLFQQLDVVDRSGADRDSRQPQGPDELIGEQEVLDLYAGDAVAHRPTRQHVRRVVGPDDEAGSEAGRRGHLARVGVKADHLEPAPLRRVAKALADGRRRPAGEFRVRLRLDLDLHDQLWWSQLEQPGEGHRRLTNRRTARIENARPLQLFRVALVDPARERGAQGEERVVQQDELAVRRQAGVSLDTLHRSGERAAQRRLRVVRAISPAQPMGDQIASHGDRRVSGPTQIDVKPLQTGGDHLVKQGSAQRRSQPMIRG
jgi:hypothetical protein